MLCVQFYSVTSKVARELCLARGGVGLELVFELKEDQVGEHAHTWAPA